MVLPCILYIQPPYWNVISMLVLAHNFSNHVASWRVPLERRHVFKVMVDISPAWLTSRGNDDADEDEDDDDDDDDDDDLKDTFLNQLWVRRPSWCSNCGAVIDISISTAIAYCFLLEITTKWSQTVDFLI